MSSEECEFRGILKKRVHEIAKQEGLSSKEVLAALKAAGIEAKVAASSVEEEEALKALAAAGATAKGGAPRRPPRTAQGEGEGSSAGAEEGRRKAASDEPALSGRLAGCGRRAAAGGSAGASAAGS